MAIIHIADNFYDFVTDLSLSEVKQVQKAIRLIKSDPSNPSLRRHKLIRVKSNDVVSYSPNSSIRIISYEPDGENTYLLYVNHHDDAYNWAQTRRIDRDTASQVLRVARVSSQEIEEEPADENEVPSDSPVSYSDLLPERDRTKAYLFDSYLDGELAENGLPTSYLPLARRVSNESDVMFLIGKVPPSIGDALFALADTLSLKAKFIASDEALPERTSSEEVVNQALSFKSYATDDALQGWLDELEKALELPFQKWRFFLHPSQRKAVNAWSNGPLRIVGGAGTGKTVVGLHRARQLADTQYSGVKILTYNRTLMNNLTILSAGLFGNDLGGKFVIQTFHGFIADRLRASNYEVPRYEWNESAFLSVGLKAIEPVALAKSWTPDLVTFIFREIVNVIVAQRILDLSSYVRAPRKGTGRTLSVKQKEELWKVYEISWEEGKRSRKIHPNLMAHYASQLNIPALNDAALVVDEVQDLLAADLRFLSEQARGPNQLTLLEDTKQRIYGSGYSLKALGINVSGRRSIKLFVNYRTTEEIGRAAGRALGSLQLTTLDYPISLRKGPEPELKRFSSSAQEYKWVVEQIVACQKKKKRQIAVVARSRAVLEAMESVLETEGLACAFLDRDSAELPDDVVMLCTMHSIKGLEFEAVFIVGLDYGKDGIRIPKELSDDAVASKDFVRREKHLLYVAMSRARDELYLSGNGQILDELAFSE